MMTFADLKFEPHPIKLPGHSFSRTDFDNGFGISVVTGRAFYTDEHQPYEVGFWFGDKLTSMPELNHEDEVLGWQTAEQVTELMERIQKLERRGG